MMKKTISILSALVLLLVLLSPLSLRGYGSIEALANTSAFKDVPANLPAYEAISALVERNVLSGFKDGSFRPNETVTRGQFAVMLSRALNLPKANSNFKDVPKSATLYDGISRAAAAGLVLGDKGSFLPNKGVSNSDVAIMLNRAMNMNGNFEGTVDLWYPDKGGIGRSALESVKRMTRYGVMTGNSIFEFQPNEFANRGESSVYIHRALNLIEGTAAIPAKLKAPLLKNKAAEVEVMAESLMLYDNKRTEQELLASLKSAFESMDKSQFIDHNLTNNITVTLAVIDRKIDFIGWNDVNGLYTIMQTGVSSNLNNLVKSDIGFSAVEMIERMHTKAENLKRTGPLKDQKKNISESINVVTEDISYMTVNQREYDTVLNIVNSATKGIEERVIGGKDSKYYSLFLDGERGNWDRNDPQARTERNMGLISAEIRMRDLVEAGVSKKEIIRIVQTAELAAELTGSIQYFGPNSWSYGSYSDYLECQCLFPKSPANAVLALSAYDGLVRGLGGSSVSENIYAAVFEVMGYRIKYVDHKMMFEVNGAWWNRSLTKVD